MSKPTNGVVSESYHYAIDGEYYSGYIEYNVVVTDWWKTGDKKNTAKEVRVGTRYYRETVTNGWRVYYKEEKTYKSNRYTGTQIVFTPNITTSGDDNWNNVNLGSW